MAILGQATDAPAIELSDQWLTVAEVADWLRVPEKTVADWAVHGRIPSLKLGRHRRISRLALEAWLASQQRPEKGEVTAVANTPIPRPPRRGKSQ